MSASVQNGAPLNQLLAAQLDHMIDVNVADIRKSVSEKNDLQELFHHLIKKTANMSQQMASGLGINPAEFVRKDEDVKKNIIGFTYYNNNNNTQILEFLSSQMEQLSHDNMNFTEKRREVSDICSGISSAFEIEVLEPSDIRQLGWDQEPSFVEENDATVRAMFSLNQRGEQLTDKSIYREIKQKYPSFYKRKKMAMYLDFLNTQTPEPIGKGKNEEYIGNFSDEQALYILGTARLQVNGKRYATSQYLTRMYRQQSEDPVDRLKKYSTVLILDQDVFLVDDMMKDIAKLFKRAIEWTSDVKELKNRVGLLCYKFYHAQPYKLRNDFIVNALEGAIYRYHGFDFEKSDCLQDTVKISPLLGPFIEKYHSMRQLEIIQ